MYRPYLCHGFVLQYGDEILLGLVLFIMPFTVSPNKLISVDSSYSVLVSPGWSFLIEYSTAEMKTNGDKASPYFKPFLT
jgi:hypothetical protein